MKEDDLARSHELSALPLGRCRCGSHLYALVPFFGKRSMWEVFLHEQVIFEHGEVVVERIGIEEVDLSVRKSGFHPFFQQLNHILKVNDSMERVSSCKHFVCISRFFLI